MATVRKTITVTDQQSAWIKSRITAGDYTNDSEYLRDLIRQDQINNDKLVALRMAIQDGLDSGVSDKNIPQLMAEVERYQLTDVRYGSTSEAVRAEPRLLKDESKLAHLRKLLKEGENSGIAEYVYDDFIKSLDIKK